MKFTNITNAEENNRERRRAYNATYAPSGTIQLGAVDTSGAWERRTPRQPRIELYCLGINDSHALHRYLIMIL